MAKNPFSKKQQIEGLRKALRSKKLPPAVSQGHGNPSA